MKPILILTLTTLLSSRAFAYSWVMTAETENPCAYPEQRAHFKAAYFCHRTDASTAIWEPSWVCLTLPKEGGDKLVTLYTQTNKYFYEDLMHLKLTVPAKNKLKSLTGSQTGSAKDRQSAWDKIKIVLDKHSGIMQYTDTTSLPYAPAITHAYEFHFQCAGAVGPALDRLQDLDIAGSDD